MYHQVLLHYLGFCLSPHFWNREKVALLPTALKKKKKKIEARG